MKERMTEVIMVVVGFDEEGKEKRECRGRDACAWKKKRENIYV